MDSEKKRSDEYWMGVRDALRMVDSFTKWARRNRSRAKDLDDFIHDGLVAAAKRCESCLKDDLGLTFVEDGEEPGELPDSEQVPSGYEMAPPQTEETDDFSFEVTPEDMSPEGSEVQIETDSESISIDTVGRLEDEEMNDLAMDGPPREFSSDFDLVEPSDLVVASPDTKPEPEVTPEPQPEPDVTEPVDTESKPSFTWTDYEKAVTPAKEELEPDIEVEDVELPPPVELASEEPQITPDVPESISDARDIPEPPSIPVDEFEEEEVEDTSEESEPITEPPPPPPPPESDEDEEERRRRARRLFFGD